MLSLLLACATEPPVDSVPQVMPEIQALSLSCDRDAAQWDLELETSGWVNSATWWITPPGLPVEAHSVRSVLASPSGDFERLTLRLQQLSDPRLQENNSSTAALCPEMDTAMRLSIFEVEQGDLAECWQWGGTLDWASLELTDDCEIRDLSW
ncbi:MAG: hypothetical protein ACI9VR_003148 [Cognaticolwellia sp.]|jgi:hypothetical protein